MRDMIYGYQIQEEVVIHCSMKDLRKPFGTISKELYTACIRKKKWTLGWDGVKKLHLSTGSSLSKRWQSLTNLHSGNLYNNRQGHKK